MQNRRSRGERIAEGAAFAIYLVVLIYFLFFSEKFGREGGCAHGVNTIPFHEIRRFIVYRHVLGIRSVLMNLAGNIVAFMPFGMFLPVILRKRPHGMTVILLGALFSAAVEITQLVTGLGSCDVDDVILNTVGVILGWIIYWIAHCIRRGVIGNGRKR